MATREEKLQRIQELEALLDELEQKKAQIRANKGSDFERLFGMNPIEYGIQSAIGNVPTTPQAPLPPQESQVQSALGPVVDPNLEAMGFDVGIGPPPTREDIRGGFWSGVEELVNIPVRPTKAVARSLSEQIVQGKPIWDDLLMGGLSPRAIELMFGSLEDITAKGTTEPIVKKAAQEGLAPDFAVDLFYGAGLSPGIKSFAMAGLKREALKGNIEGVNPEDLPAQVSPAGLANFIIDNVGLDALIGAGATKVGIAALKEGGEAVIKAGARKAIADGIIDFLTSEAKTEVFRAAKTGEAPTLSAAKKALGLESFAVNTLTNESLISAATNAKVATSLETALRRFFGTKSGKVVEAMIGKFVKHVGPQAPVRMAVDKWLRKLTVMIHEIGDVEEAVARSVRETIDEEGLDPAKTTAIMTDIGETFQAEKAKVIKWGDEAVEPGSQKGMAALSEEPPFTVTPEGTALQPGQTEVVRRTPKKPELDLEAFDNEIFDPAIAKAEGKFKRRQTKIARRKPEIVHKFRALSPKAQADLIEARLASVPKDKKALALRNIFEFILPPETIKSTVKKRFPGISDKGADTLANAIDHYMHIGDNVLFAEQWEGLPLHRLKAEDKNYMLHYATDELRDALGQRFKDVDTDEVRIVADVFHPSMKGRQLDMTIQEANDLAANGQAYVSVVNGKRALNFLKEGEDLPDGAKLIRKVFETDPSRLATIRKTRAVKAIVAKNMLEDIFASIPEYSGQGATTIKDLIGPENFNKIFAVLKGLEKGAFLNKKFDRRTAQAILYGIHRMQNFSKLTDSGLLKAFDAVQNIWKPITLYFYPKYYVRNQISAMWNEYANGNLLGTMYGYGRIFANAEKDIAAGLKPSITTLPEYKLLAKHGLYNRSQATADIARGIHFGEKSAQAMLGNDSGTHWIGAAAELQENMIRTASAIGWMEKGYTPAAAVKKVMESQFDYFDLTEFEWTVMKRIFPFYTWSRKNIPFQLKKLAERPGRITPLIRGINRAMPDDEEMAQLFDSIQDRLPIKVGKDKYMPLEDTWAFADIMKLGDPLQMFYDHLSPFAKVPAETFSWTRDGVWSGWGPLGRGEMTGYSLFTHQPLKKWYKPTVDVLGVPMDPRLSNIFRSSFRMVTEIEKTPWYPPEEGAPLGPSKTTKALNMFGIPFYENRPQQQVYFNIRELEGKIEDIGGYHLQAGNMKQKRKYVELEMDRIYNLGLVDALREPFRGVDRELHENAAVYNELSDRYGVDVKKIREENPVGYKEEILKAMGLEPTDDNILNLMDDIAIARSVVITRGGVEVYADIINSTKNLLDKNRREKKNNNATLLNDKEKEWLEDVLVAATMKGINYLDYYEGKDEETWFDFKEWRDKWAADVKAYTGSLPRELVATFSERNQKAYDEMNIDLLVKPSLEKYDELLGKIVEIQDSPFTDSALLEHWQEQYLKQTLRKYDYLWGRGQVGYADTLRRMQNTIKKDELPLSTRRALGRKYNDYVNAWIAINPKKKTYQQWIQDNIVPLFAEE